MLAPICVFLILLFIYVHIRYHIRPGSDPIIYELADPSRDLLHDTIHHKQPVKFSTTLGVDLGLEWSVLLKANTTKHINVGEDMVSMSVKELIDVSNNILIHSNNKFIDEIGLTETFASVAHPLRPHMMTRVIYDLIGNHGSGDVPIHTIPTTSSAHITYLACTSGSANIRMCSGKYTKRLCRDTAIAPIVSYISFWDNSGNIANEELFTQIDTLDATLTPDHAMAIPAHWWYSVEIPPQTNLAVFSYRSAMNELACLPETVRSFI